MFLWVCVCGVCEGVYMRACECVRVCVFHNYLSLVVFIYSAR